MTKIAELAEQHIREHESRLKHIDELMARAHAGAGPEQAETGTELKKLTVEREELAGHLERMRLRSLEDWQEKEIELSGPMGIWDAVAQQLEKLVERLER